MGEPVESYDIPTIWRIDCLRLPLWVGMDEAQDKVIAQLQAAI